MDFYGRWEGYTRAVNSELETAFECDIPETLKAAMKYSVFAGGKRLRPALTLASAELFGDGKRALPIAAGLEMIHTYSLIHDDLPAMDNDTLRRGKATNHVVFGEATAILAGDALLNHAFTTMLQKTPAENPAPYISAVRSVAECAGACGMVAGQIADMLAEQSRANDEATLMYMHRRKTGALLKAAVTGGALAEGAGREDIAALEDYAESFGLAFQIADDVLDVTGDAAKLGKSTGKDFCSGKLTFVSVYGLEKAKKLAGEYTEKAVAALERCGESADFLREMARFMLTREK